MEIGILKKTGEIQIIDVTPGQIINLAPDEEVRYLSPLFSTADYYPARSVLNRFYFDMILAQLAAGLGC